MAVRRALLSVHDKTGIVEFANGLVRRGVEIISTGGTGRLLRDHAIPVRDVGEVTGFPEMMDGRIKTLHPLIAGGVLAVRDDPSHVASMEEHGIGAIDLVCVNLYPFEQTAAKGAPLDDLIEQIDIGGPSLLRAAAKNHKHVLVVTDPSQYDAVLQAVAQGEVAPELRESPKARSHRSYASRWRCRPSS